MKWERTTLFILSVAGESLATPCSPPIHLYFSSYCIITTYTIVPSSFVQFVAKGNCVLIEYINIPDRATNDEQMRFMLTK